MPENIPWMARRARLLLGQTQAQFAELLGVEDGTVSRWERGKLQPAPTVLAKLNEIITTKGSMLGDRVVRASPVYKFLVPMSDLKKAVVVSKGARAALQKAGVPYNELSD